MNTSFDQTIRLHKESLRPQRAQAYCRWWRISAGSDLLILSCSDAEFITAIGISDGGFLLSIINSCGPEVVGYQLL